MEGHRRARAGLGDALAGRVLPDVTLACHLGEPVRLALVAERPLVIYTFPGVARPPAVAAGDAALHAAFDRHTDDLDAHMLRAVGLSSEPARALQLRAARYRVLHELWSDPGMLLARALGLPTHSDGSMCCYQRLVLVTRGGTIAKAFYPVASPQRAAAQVITWLRATGR